MPPINLELPTLLEDFGWYAALTYLHQQHPSAILEKAVEIVQPQVDLSRYSEQEMLQALSTQLEESKNQKALTVNQIQSLKFLFATTVLLKKP